MDHEIEKLMVNGGDDLFYTPAFRNMIENHLPDLTDPAHCVNVVVDNKDADDADGDFYALLHQYKVRPEHRWTCLRMNQMTAPNQYKSNMVHILVPREDFIKKLVKRFKTSQSMGVKRKK